MRANRKWKTDISETIENILNRNGIWQGVNVRHNIGSHYVFVCIVNRSWETIQDVVRLLEYELKNVSQTVHEPGKPLGQKMQKAINREIQFMYLLFSSRLSSIINFKIFIIFSQTTGQIAANVDRLVINRVHVYVFFRLEIHHTS